MKEQSFFKEQGIAPSEVANREGAGGVKDYYDSFDYYLGNVKKYLEEEITSGSVAERETKESIEKLANLFGKLSFMQQRIFKMERSTFEDNKTLLEEIGRDIELEIKEVLNEITRLQNLLGTFE